MPPGIFAVSLVLLRNSEAGILKYLVVKGRLQNADLLDTPLVQTMLDGLALLRLLEIQLCCDHLLFKQRNELPQLGLGNLCLVALVAQEGLHSLTDSIVEHLEQWVEGNALVVNEARV